MNTKEKVINIKYNNPRYTLQQIGDECGITKQRVYTILKKAYIPTKKFNRIYNISKYTKKCLYCKIMIRKGGWKRFCSEDCRNNYLYIYYPCTYCHNNIKMLRCVFKNKINVKKQLNFFCNKSCYNKYRKNLTQ